MNHIVGKLLHLVHNPLKKNLVFITTPRRYDPLRNTYDQSTVTVTGLPIRFSHSVVIHSSSKRNFSVVSNVSLDTMVQWVSLVLQRK